MQVVERKRAPKNPIFEARRALIQWCSRWSWRLAVETGLGRDSYLVILGFTFKWESKYKCGKAAPFYPLVCFKVNLYKLLLEAKFKQQTIKHLSSLLTS